MAQGNAIQVGLIGFGTIGTGVVKVLQQNASVIEKRLGFPLALRRVADLDTDRDRGVELQDTLFDADAEGLVRDPEVDIVIELMGGYDVARRFTLDAIEHGKHVVTANKALLALHGKEIFGAARKQGVDVAFEASVGGGIPILRALREGLAANRIESLHGIMNGTTNYVLTEMERGGEDFEVVLKRAQDLGYAEANPGLDVDGVDAAHKLAILAGMAFGAEMTYEDIPTSGIRNLIPLDFEAADTFGYRIKLLGIGKQHRDPTGGRRVEVRVHPTLVPKDSLLASVDGAMNAIAVRGDAVGPTLYYGAGAGEMPTASAVVADLMEVAREIRRGAAGRVSPLSYLPETMQPLPQVPQGDLQTRYYLRFSASDRPGALSQISGELGEHGIGIESVLQKGRARESESVPLLILTHSAREGAVRAALERIDAAGEVNAPTELLRIEEDV